MAKHLLALAAVVFFINSASVVAEESGGPQVIVANPNVNFGSVKEGTTVTSQFSILNSGTAPLEFGKIQTACGCVVASLGEAKLAPGAETLLTVNFDTTGFSGEKTRVIRVNSNDPKRPWLPLTLSGVVVSDVSVEPRRVYLGSISQTQVAERTLKLRLAPGVKLKDFSSKTEGLTVSSEEQGGGYSLKVSLGQGQPAGNFQGRVVIRTTSSKQPIVNVPVFARIQGDLVADPQEASFGLIEGPLKEPQQIEIHLTNLGNQPIPLPTVESSSDVISAEIEPISPGKDYKLNISLLRGSVGPVRSQVMVNYIGADAQSKRLVIPVFAILSRRGD